MKNWAAGRPLPANGREKLLAEAAASGTMNSYEESGIGWWLFSKELNGHFTGRPSFQLFAEPFSQSRMVSVHLALSARLAT